MPCVRFHDPKEGYQVAHFQNPRCQAPDMMNGQEDRKCGVEMKLMGERHPLWRPGFFIFVCPRCEALRSISEADAAKYARRR